MRNYEVENEEQASIATSQFKLLLWADSTRKTIPRKSETCLFHLVERPQLLTGEVNSRGLEFKGVVV